MDNQYGGVKRKADEIDSPGFTPVYDMINIDRSKLSVLTVDSLKGFMINLTADSTDSKYLNLGKTQFTAPVTDFILKFVIIKGTNDFTPLESYKKVKIKSTDDPTHLEPDKYVHKSCETQDSFFEETKLQQYIWKNSITAGRPAICPSVANLSMFDTVNSARLMWFLRKKVNREPITTTSVFDFLFNNSKINSRGIGILTMPAITQSTTLYEFSNLPNNSNFFGIIITNKVKLYVISNVFAQIVRLFIEIGVIHFDLHPGNVMVYLAPDNKIKTLLIDFGRASDIMSDEPDSIFHKNEDEDSNDKYIAEKTKIRANKKYFYNIFLDNPPSNATGKDKHDYIQHVLAYIAKIELDINNPLYYRDGKTYQMQWYEDYKEKYPEVFVYAFNILDTMTRINVDKKGIVLETIEKYEQNGSFINLDNPEGIDAFKVPYPGPIRQVPPPATRVSLPPPATRVSLPPPSIKPESSNVNVESLTPDSKNSVKQVDRTKDDFEQTDQSPDVDENSLTPYNKRRRTDGGRKNKHHKTNKRKQCKSKRNRRNKNKNTRKKRKN